VKIKIYKKRERWSEVSKQRQQQFGKKNPNLLVLPQADTSM